MRYLLYPFLTVTVVFLMLACDSESDQPEVDADGLTAEVRQFVPPDVLNGLAEIGHPINGGSNPPNINGTFYASPLILAGSNLAGDTLPMGTVIDSIYLMFSNQSGDLDLDAIYSSVKGAGLTPDRSYVVGEGCRFTVFSKYDNTTPAGAPWASLRIVSGCLTEAGIENAFYTNVLLEDNDEAFGDGWQPGQGRMFSDADGLAERQ